MSRDPAFLLQLLLYAVLYLFTVSTLLNIQRKNNDKQILKEKLTEDIHWTQEEIRKKDELKKALEKKVDRFLDLRKFSEELKSIKDVEIASQRIVKEVSEILGKADECVLYLVNENQQQLSLLASHSCDRGVVKEKEGSIVDQWVMKKAQGLMIEDMANDFRFPVEIKIADQHPRSICANPLMTGNKVMGVVRASAMKPGIFNTDDLRLLDIFSNLGSVTLKNLLLYKKMEEMAIHDSLTGLYLNRYFKERLSAERQRADYGHKLFALIMIDIDYFKKYNDDYGHSAGDIVLRSIASIIRSCLEAEDLAARYGGEEFILLLPNRNKKEAMAVAEKIRSKIETHPFVFRRVDVGVTASFGVVAYPEEGGSEEELLQTVDRYLYHAKRIGRNHVCGN